MLGTAVIVFREFLEAFLIVSVFLGISKKCKLGKEAEILLAAALGCAFSFLLVIVTYFFGSVTREVLTQSRAELLGSYLQIFSGLFLTYVIFSLHGILRRARGGTLIKAHQKLQSKRFDVSLFISIAALVAREGFEIALFTASTSLFSLFSQNLLGLLLGFLFAFIVGLLSFSTYLRFPLGKIMRGTEYMIILFGASLVQNGLTEFFEQMFNIRLSQFVSFHLSFLPAKDTLVGHLVVGLTGIDQEFSLLRLSIMGAYVLSVYVLFLRRTKLSQSKV